MLGTQPGAVLANLDQGRAVRIECLAQGVCQLLRASRTNAVATQALPAADGPAYAESRPSAETAVVETVPVKSPLTVMLPDVVQAPPAPEKTKTETEPAPAAKKSLFWSAVVQNQGNPGRSTEAAAEVSVPPMLRNLRKCQACGFPVSQGRAFCVECEERQWRGQRLSQLRSDGV